MANSITYNPIISKRFRGFHPVIIDVETGGLNHETDALLEIAAVTINCDEQGIFTPAETHHHHITPFEGGKLNPESLAINNIDPFHPFRFAIDEKDALQSMFKFLRGMQKQSLCTKCILVGHNSWFDLTFLNSAIKRSKIKKNPFHPFTSLDTATLSALVYGQTVLAQALQQAKIPFDPKSHHSAVYDATQTALLFCKIVNQWQWPKKDELLK